MSFAPSLFGRPVKILPLTPKYLEAWARTEGTEKLRRKWISAASVMNVIRYAYLDGKPVRLNDREAWWLVDGVWKALHPADVGHDAKLISEEQFNSMFPSLPQLPSTAFQRHLE